MRALLLVIIFLFFLASPVAAQQTEFTIENPDDTSFYGPWSGFGAEWDPFLWNNYNQSQGVTETDWDLITQRVSEIKMPITRMWMQVFFAKKRIKDWQYEHTWDWENDNMKSLYKYLDYACANDIEVIIDDWGWSMWPSYQLYNGPPPANPAYTNDVAEYLKELIDRRGYSCIKGVILGNEPDYEIIDVNGVTYDDFAQLYKNLDQALRNNGLRSRLKLIGPGPACCQSTWFGTLPLLKDVLDVYDFHLYASMGSTGSTPGYIWQELDSRRDWLLYDELFGNNPQAAGRPIYVTESGMIEVGSNNSWQYALDMADYGVSALSSRIQSAIAWNMHDVFYFMSYKYNPPNQMISWGMWTYKSNGWKLRPWAQTWGLLTRFAPRGSQRSVISTQGVKTPPNKPSGNLRLSALKKPQGGWSVFVVNRNSSSINININFPTSDPKNFERYEVTSNTINQYPDRMIIPKISSVQSTTSMSASIPAKSLVVFSEPDGPTVSPPGTIAGDTNDDGLVNITDYNNVVSDFGSTEGRSDLNKNGKVDIFDFNILVINYLK